MVAEFCLQMRNKTDHKNFLSTSDELGVLTPDNDGSSNLNMNKDSAETVKVEGTKTSLKET